MTKFVQLLIIGIATGSIYGLIALGFTLVYKATKVFNFAQGDLMMLGAYFAVLFTVTCGLEPVDRDPGHGADGDPRRLALPARLRAPLIGQPFLPVTMATIGGSLVIVSIIPYFWGVIERSYPTQFPQERLRRRWRQGLVDRPDHDRRLRRMRARVRDLLQVHDIGLQMRAAATHNEAAILSGINVHRVSLVAWGISTILAFIGGVVLANQQGNVTSRSARSGCSRSRPS